METTVGLVHLLIAALDAGVIGDFIDLETVIVGVVLA